MTPDIVLFALAIVLAFYMAWNMGANDVANAMGTSVGSGALTLKKALIVAAFLEFAGAFFAGTEVSKTIESGIINPFLYESHPYQLVLGMLASLLASGIWLQIASFYGWPVSTTHSIVGALIGFGIVTKGWDAIYWKSLLYIIGSWILSPLIGGVLAYLIFTLVRKKVLFSTNPALRSRKLMPWFAFIAVAFLVLVICYNGLASLELDLPFKTALGIAVIIGALAFIFFKLFGNHKEEPALQTVAPTPATAEPAYVSHLHAAIHHLQSAKETIPSTRQPLLEKILNHLQRLPQKLSKKAYLLHTPSLVAVEKSFITLQILSACCMAFAHGANDVANAIGPLASIFSILKNNTISIHESTPIWILSLGGIGIVTGLATWGWRVIETLGKKITELTPSRGFCAEFAAAITILLASKLGLPISTTHTLVGAVLGVGLARGIDALNLGVIREIIISWIVTVPAGALLSILIYYILQACFM